MTANKAAIRWCAVYTRKSSEEGLEQQFNSLHAQREAAEAYIKSQRHEGWRLLAEKYDDGGYSGGNLERPALKASSGRHPGRQGPDRGGLQS
jgi:site-specific DNA recombinase